MDARSAILARARAALRDVPTDDDVAVPRDYDVALPLGADVFAERVAEYRATVHRVERPAEVPGTVRAICDRHGARRLAVAPGVPDEWRPDTIEWLEDPGHAALDAAGGVLTGCAAGIALTGTIVLDGGPRSGRRALTLLPDLHLCVIEAAQIASTLAEALAGLRPDRPITFVSGPSATSDIELSRVEGVHGPRRLEVLLVG